MKCQSLDIQISGKVNHFKADPFHGFLFWIENGSKLVQLELGCNGNPPEQGNLLRDVDNKTVRRQEISIYSHTAQTFWKIYISW
jgi:hypothetical protein